MGESIGLMAVAGFAAVKTGVRIDRAVEAVGNFAGFNFVGQISDAVENARRLIDVIAHHFELRRAGQHEKSIHARFNRAASVQKKAVQIGRPRKLGLGTLNSFTDHVFQ